MEDLYTLSGIGSHILHNIMRTASFRLNNNLPVGDAIQSLTNAVKEKAASFLSEEERDLLNDISFRLDGIVIKVHASDKLDETVRLGAEYFVKAVIQNVVGVDAEVSWKYSYDMYACLDCGYADKYTLLAEIAENVPEDKLSIVRDMVVDSCNRLFRVVLSTPTVEKMYLC